MAATARARTRYAGGVSEAWRETMLLDVPMRGVRAAAHDEALREGDPRFELDGVVLVTERGAFRYSVRRSATWLHGVSRTGPDRAAHASETLESAVAWLSLFTPVVDTDGTPIGLLGWDDAVRFALERGDAGDACWARPASAATRPHGAITPIAGLLERRLGVLRTVREVAAAMLRVPPALHGTNDAAQYVLGEDAAGAFGGFVTPRDLLRAIFGDPRTEERLAP